VRVALVTGELAPLEDFGPEASATVAALLAERGVELHLHTLPEAFDGRSLFVPMAGQIAADVVVALPALAGRHVPGLPHDARGFVEVDDHCRVHGVDDVFAIGDMTARELKQGGLAAQQGDVVAAVIAAGSGSVAPYTPVLRAMLLTGDAPLYLRYPPGAEQRHESSTGAPWWPAHKIVGTHLGPYLATHAELLVTG
jgi:sulfide:quinone oxidoreductase